MRLFIYLSLYINILATSFIGAQAGELSPVNLRDGDVLLQPLHCWTCSLIEAQENSIYSHVGVFIIKDNAPFVLESWGKVKLTPFDEFMAKTQKDQQVLVRRFKELRFKRSDLLERLPDFLEKNYDSKFLWDNADDKGEMLYCSELVYKFLWPFYGEALPIKIMNYNVHREHWIRYFRGLPPDGKWGNSPGDFEKSSLLKDVGVL